MELALILTILVLAALFIILFRVLKTILNIVFIISTVVIILLFIAGFLIYSDASDFKSRFPAGPNLVLLVSEKAVLTGFVLGSSTRTLNQSALSAIASELHAKGPLSAGKGYYKVITVDKALLLSPAMRPIRIGGEVLGREGAADLLDSAAGPEAKSMIFAAVFSGGILQQPALLVSGLRSGEIRVYPDTPLFKAARLLPIGLLQSAVVKTMNSTDTLIAQLTEVE